MRGFRVPRAPASPMRTAYCECFKTIFGNSNFVIRTLQNTLFLHFYSK